VLDLPDFVAYGHPIECPPQSTWTQQKHRPGSRARFVRSRHPLSGPQLVRQSPAVFLNGRAGEPVIT